MRKDILETGASLLNAICGTDRFVVAPKYSEKDRIHFTGHDLKIRRMIEALCEAGVVRGQMLRALKADGTPVHTLSFDCDEISLAGLRAVASIEPLRQKRLRDSEALINQIVGDPGFVFTFDGHSLVATETEENFSRWPNRNNPILEKLTNCAMIDGFRFESSDDGKNTVIISNLNPSFLREYLKQEAHGKHFLYTPEQRAASIRVLSQTRISEIAGDAVYEAGKGLMLNNGGRVPRYGASMAYRPS